MSRTSVTHQEETRGPIPTPEEASWKKACCLLKFKAKSKVSVSGWTWKACLSHVKPQAEKQLFEELAVSCNLQLGHLTRSAFPSLLLHASIQGIILPQLTQIQQAVYKISTIFSPFLHNVSQKLLAGCYIPVRRISINTFDYCSLLINSRSHLPACFGWVLLSCQQAAAINPTSPGLYLLCVCSMVQSSWYISAILTE